MFCKIHLVVKHNTFILFGGKKERGWLNSGFEPQLTVLRVAPVGVMQTFFFPGTPFFSPQIPKIYWLMVDPKLRIDVTGGDQSMVSAGIGCSSAVTLIRTSGHSPQLDSEQNPPPPSPEHH